jgi:hypothetical protein
MGSSGFSIPNYNSSIISSKFFGLQFIMLEDFA